MAIKSYKPTTPSRRYMSTSDFSQLSKKKKRQKGLTVALKKKAGRNVHGKITVRHRGGGSKRFYRKIDFKQLRVNDEATVVSVEYDPNRTAYIMLVEYKDGEKAYMLAPTGVKEGNKIISSDNLVEPVPGNRMPLEHIPDGAFIYNIELAPGAGGKLVRSAGTSATLMTKDAGFAQVKMPSGEIRLISEKCKASVGQLSNSEHGNRVIGKAGRIRHMGKRPTVRGKAMNPVDHPHGGGEGRAPIGMTHPKTPWGKPALGRRTRKKKKYSDKLIVRSRRNSKR
jgi:large subunit ribosomal protein L2